MKSNLELQHEIEQLLYREAELLDERRFDDWLEMLTEDYVYQAPVRLTREAGQTEDLSYDMLHFDDDMYSLKLRIERLKTDFAWAEDPPSRTRHYVTNVRVEKLEGEGERYRVKSYFLVYRNRGDDPVGDMLAGEKEDIVVREGDTLKFAKRIIVLDQATLGTRNLSIFV